MAISIKNYFDMDSSRNIRARNKVRMVWILLLFGIILFGSLSIFPYLYAGLSLLPFIVLTLYILMEGRNFFNLKRPLGIAYFILLLVTCNLLIKGIGIIFYIQGVLINFFINLGFATLYFGLIWFVLFRKR